MKPNQRLIILQPKVRLIDPHVNTDDRNTLNPLFNMFEALVKVNAQGGYEGVLCERWEVSADARQWVFHLRRAVKFHDGSPLTAADVAASYNRMINPETAGELATQGIYQGYLGDAEIRARDELTLQINMPEPMADLLDFLVKFPVASLGGLQQQPERLIGTGPYTLERIRSGQIEMTAFMEYWGGEPAFGQVIWEEEPSPQRRVEALLSGKADLVSAVDASGAQEIRAGQQARLVSMESSVCTVFMCNHARGVCADRKIRQALNYGLDKDEIIRDVMHGAARPLNGPLTALHLGYNPDSPVYPHDPQKARALLAEAGYAQGMDLVLDVPLKLPDEALALAERMRDQYQRVGIRTTIRQFADRPMYASMVRDKQIDDACCFDSSPLSTYQVLSDKFHSRLHGAWWQGYQNPQVDALIDQARATPQYAPRKALYQQAYALLNEDAAWIFLHNPILMWGAGPNAAAFEANPAGLIRLS